MTSDGWEGNYRLFRGSTKTEYVGDLADLPLLTNYLQLTLSANIKGNIADAPPVKILIVNGCTLLTGDLADLPASITGQLNVSGCENITGNLQNLHNINYLLGLSHTKVKGAYTNVSGYNAPDMYLSDTQLSSADMDTTLIAFAQCTKTGGTFSASGMTRTSASDEAVAHLTTPVSEGGLGWTVSGLTKL